MLVGYKSVTYPEQRNIIGIVDNIQYQKCWNIFTLPKTIGRVLNSITKRKIFSSTDLSNQFYDFNLNQVSLFHFFNAISYGHTPWITTFETIIPRFDCVLAWHSGSKPDLLNIKNQDTIRRGLVAISSNYCKRIIAMSNCNANMQRQFLQKFPEYKESIETKLIVIHPPQKVYISHYSDKHLSWEDKIKFIFVGASFFRKGGMEVIETLKFLKTKYKYPIELTIVSSLQIDNYASQEKNDDIKKAKEFIQKNLDWIDYFPKLPNHQVIELMKNSHVGLLPTYADTYGYSVLEFQATGCPVITTNVRALPEINNNSTGWIIEVPRNSLGEAIYSTKADRIIISDLIRKGLEQIIHEIFSDRTIIPNKSNESILRIKEKHSINNYAEKLKKVYIEAINMD